MILSGSAQPELAVRSSGSRTVLRLQVHVTRISSSTMPAQFLLVCTGALCLEHAHRRQLPLSAVFLLLHVHVLPQNLLASTYALVALEHSVYPQLVLIFSISGSAMALLYRMHSIRH
jgi:hypothetical protein